MKLLPYISVAIVCLVSSCNVDYDVPDVPGAADKENTDKVVPTRGVEVLEYNPAPGQFVNEAPPYVAGDTPASMLAKAQQYINSGYLISLGAWGGHVVFALQKPIVPKADGRAEFRIDGNAFINGVTDDGYHYGSCEPGIVEVMYDANGNGRADDEWCLIPPGVSYRTNVSVTYTAHAPGDDDEHFVRWQCDDDRDGWILRNASSHTHNMFPAWLTANTLTFRGVMLPDNGRWDEQAREWRLIAVPNTADSYINGSANAEIHIADAVHADGTPALLPAVHFVRITTGVLQCCGALGEVSTEVSAITVL